MDVGTTSKETPKIMETGNHFMTQCDRNLGQV